MRFTDRKTLFTDRIPLLSIRSIRTDRHMAYTDRYGAGVLDNSLAFWLIKRQLSGYWNLYARARVYLANKQYYGCFTTFIDLQSYISLHRNDEHGIGKTAWQKEAVWEHIE